MSRRTRRANRLLSAYELDAHAKIRQRNADQMEQMAEPGSPATGTARISALMADVRRRRDAAASSTAGSSATEIALDRGIELVDNPFRPATPQGEPAPPAA